MNKHYEDKLIHYSVAKAGYYHAQKGVALIVVLLFLILIMLAGVMAVRQSNTDLKTATADQINTILLQSSDSANQKLETMINGDPTSQDYKDATSVAGMFGHYILNPDNQGNEYIYCFNPRNRQYLLKDATVYKAGGGTLYNNNGICDFNSADSYSSDRQTAMTQMNLTTTPPSANTENFGHMVIGKDAENSSSTKYKFDIRSTSTIPSYNPPTGCMGKSSIPVTVSGVTSSPILDCLHNANTPTKMLYEQADLQNLSSSTQCYPFGRGSMNNKCVLKP